MRTLCTVVVLVLALVGTATAEDRAAAERSFRTAERAYKAQNFAAAIHHYEAAYKALPLPEIAFSAAQAYRKQFRVEPKPEYVRRAIALYEIYLEKVKTGGRVGDAADNLGEMKLELLRLETQGKLAPEARQQAPRTQLAISPQVGGGPERRSSGDPGDSLEPMTSYQVTIDGKPVQPFVPVDVEPGPRLVRVEAPGFIPAQTSVRAIAGVSDVVELALAPQPARVTLRTERGADVRVDGRTLGTSPMKTFELPAGPHVVSIARRGRRLEMRDLVLRRGQTVAIDMPLEKTLQRRSVTWVGTTAAALAVVAASGAVVAIIEDGRAEDRAAEIARGDASEALANRYDDAIRSRDRFSRVAWVAGGVSVAATLTALGLYWFDAPSSGTEVRFAPTAGTTGGAISVGGRF